MDLSSDRIYVISCITNLTNGSGNSRCVHAIKYVALSPFLEKLDNLGAMLNMIEIAPTIVIVCLTDYNVVSSSTVK